jgi:hypothetical protein
MSFELTAAVLRHSRLPCLEQIVLAHLADAADKNGVSYWSQEKLAERAGMPVRTFRLQIKKLRDAGLITVKRTNLTNIYTVLFRESGDAGQARAASRNTVKDESERQELPHGQAPHASRTGKSCLTDRQELPLNRSEKKSEKKPENPFASADANAGEVDSLFPIEPPQTKPAKERKVKPKPETTADPRQAFVISRLVKVYKDVTGEDLIMDPSGWSRTQSGLKKLLPLIPSHDGDYILNRWFDALTASQNCTHVPAIVHAAARPFNFLNTKNYDVVNRMVIDISQRQR